MLCRNTDFVKVLSMVSCWICIKLFIEVKIRYTYSMFMAEFMNAFKESSENLCFLCALFKVVLVKVTDASATDGYMML